MTTSAELLTPQEVARSCRVTAQTVLNWIDAGHLPAVRLSPRVVRISRAEFERFLLQRSENVRVRPQNTISELAREQGVQPFHTFEDLLGDFWPLEEDVNDFLSTISNAQATETEPVATRASQPGERLTHSVPLGT